jgi:hypothetical protein
VNFTGSERRNFRGRTAQSETVETGRVVSPVLGRRLSTVVAVEETADAAEDGAFFAPAPCDARHRGNDAVRHAAQWQRLQPDASRPGQGCEAEAPPPNSADFTLPTYWMS